MGCNPVEKKNFKQLNSNKSHKLNKMKTKQILFILPILAIFFGFISCGDDEEQANESLTESGTIGGHKYVDLGLPSGLKWATENVEIDQYPEDKVGVKCNGFYAWGEIKEKAPYYGFDTQKGYLFETYKWCEDGTYRTINKYTHEDGKKLLEREDDVATVLWGSSWRIPTKEEMVELVSGCTWSVSSSHFVCGESKTNGNKIYFQCKGYKNNYEFKGVSLTSEDFLGCYWSATRTDNDGGYPMQAWFLSLQRVNGTLYTNVFPGGNREMGYCVRAVAR